MISDIIVGTDFSFLSPQNNKVFSHAKLAAKVSDLLMNFEYKSFALIIDVNMIKKREFELFEIRNLEFSRNMPLSIIICKYEPPRCLTA